MHLLPLLQALLRQVLQGQMLLQLPLQPLLPLPLPHLLLLLLLAAQLPYLLLLGRQPLLPPQDQQHKRQIA
jgi:hypothetical protein